MKKAPDPSGPVTARAYTSLAQTEDKIRRSLNLVGDVGLTFGPEMTPIVIAGDATAIGSSTYRGRRFAFSTQTAMVTAGNDSTYIKALDTIVITGIRAVCTAGVAIPCNLGLIDAATADPAAITTPFCIWTERFITSSDLAPLVRSAIPSGVASVGFRIATWVANVGVVADLLQEPILLTAGQKLSISHVGVATAHYNLQGYVY